MFHAKPRGFDKLKPVKTEEELKAEKVLRDFEAGQYGPNAPPPPETKPKPPEKPTPPPKPAKPTPPSKPHPSGLTDPDEIAEWERRERIRKITGGK